MADPLGVAKSYAVQLLGIINTDAPRLDLIDRYVRGHHADPYMPISADNEYKLLAKRAISNWIPLVVSTPAQAMYVDSFRRGRKSSTSQTDSELPEWKHWQLSRLDARQSAVYRGALTYGHAFTVTEKTKKGVMTRGLSAMTTAAVFEDPANDSDPVAALTIIKRPDPEDKESRGRAKLWDSRRVYEVTFKALDDKDSVRIDKGVLHYSDECPVTRFAASVDLEGRTMGVVEPMIPIQDRINQTVFDLLVAQTYGSFKVRWVTGMAPPTEVEPVYAIEGDPTSEIVDWKVKLDSRGRPVPANINASARRFLFAEDENVKFGSLDETPLGGFIESLDMSIRHLAAITQTPPHHLLGQIANLSAEALQAAETALSRKIEEYRKVFGESWERVFRLAAVLEGNAASADDYSGEVLWRDMEMRSLAQAADGLGKLAEQLGIPRRGLWARVPGVTGNELDKWDELRQEDDFDQQFSEALYRASGSTNDVGSNDPTAMTE